MSNRSEELKNDVVELQRLIGLSTRQRVKDLLTIEVRKLETEVAKLSEQATANASVSPKITQPVQRCYDVKLTNYAWDQSEKYVKLFVTLKNVQSLPPEQVYCVFNKRSVDLCVKGLENRNYLLTINNLLKDIDENKSHWKVKSDMVVIFLSKTDSANWSHLTASESKFKETQKKELTDDMESSDDPSQGLMSLMKKMYNEGDDEMKRTIAKAWTEGREKNSTMDF